MTQLEAYINLRNSGITPIAGEGPTAHILCCEAIHCPECRVVRDYGTTESCRVYTDKPLTEEELQSLEFQYKATKH